MSDENKEFETSPETTQHEWSGTPFGTAPEGQPEEEQTQQVAEQPTEAAPAEPQAPSKPESGGQPVDYSNTFRSLTQGDVVKGVVVHIDREGVLVDVGTKSEGLIRPNEVSRDQSVNAEDILSVGDKIDVYVLQSEDGEGNLMLSKKRADFEQAWERVEEALKSQKLITAMVMDRVKGGLVVDLGIRGFVPASHVGGGNVKNLDRFVGQSLPLRVIEIDRERRKVVLSHRIAVEEEREKLRTQTVANLAEGQIRTGVVRRITDYGAFVDLGGIDGLLHISEMSWTRINHPSEVVKVNQKLQVMVLKLDLNAGKVSLGLRQILPDPWIEISQKYKVGDIFKGKISRLVPFGAFIQVEGGVEGIVPNSELATRRISKPEDVVSVGQEVEVKVIDLRPEERRMTLSIRQLQQQVVREKEREELQSYGFKTRDEGRTTIGDLVGDMMREAGKGERKVKKRREKELEALEEAEAYEELEEVTAEPVVEEQVAETPAEEVVAEAPVEEVAAEVEAEVEAPAEEVTPVEPEAEAAAEVVPAEEAAPAEEVAPVEETEAPAEEPVAEEEPKQE